MRAIQQAGEYHDEEVVADREAEHVLVCREGEAKTARVVRESLLPDKRDGDLLLRVERRQVLDGWGCAPAGRGVSTSQMINEDDDGTR
eukprot:2747449-Rhodomonas_salina.2